MTRGCLILNKTKKIKVGVFISGVIRELEYLPFIVQNLKREMPFADIIGGASLDCLEKYGNLSKELGIHIDYADNDGVDYNPYSDNSDFYDHYQWNRKFEYFKPARFPFGGENERQANQIRMLLRHNDLVKQYGNNFDVIVRVRWDHALGRDLQLYDLISECYKLSSTVSLAQRPNYKVDICRRMMSYDSLYQRHIGYLPVMSENPDNDVHLTLPDTPMMVDYGLLMHRSNLWDTDMVDDFHRKKSILPAEFGWYQLLFEHVENARYRHWDGGAGIFRAHKKRFKYINPEYFG